MSNVKRWDAQLMDRVISTLEKLDNTLKERDTSTCAPPAAPKSDNSTKAAASRKD